MRFKVAHFSPAVCPFGVPAASSVKPRFGDVVECLDHVTLSLRRGVKALSRESVYTRFSFQFLKEFSVSFVVSCHCFGALLLDIMNSS